MHFHKEDGICEKYFRCKECGKCEKSEHKFTHNYDLVRCRNCRVLVRASDHECHMKMLNVKGGKCTNEFCTCKKKSDSSESGVEKKTCKYEKVFGTDLNKLIENIKKNFRRLALKLHPDKGKPTSDRYKFGEMVDAYNNLREGLEIDKGLNLERNGEMVHRYIEDLKKLEINVTCSPTECTYFAQQQAPSERELTKAKGCSFTTKYIFYDYECRQESGIHIPNLIVAI